VTKNNLSLTNSSFLLRGRGENREGFFLRSLLGASNLKRLSTSQLEAILCALER
jgi:hypothetical protein